MFFSHLKQKIDFYNYDKLEISITFHRELNTKYIIYSTIFLYKCSVCILTLKIHNETCLSV